MIVSAYDPRLVMPPIGDQEPRIYSVPPKVTSRGQEALELAEMAGLTLDPWEALALDELLGVQGDGRWSSKEFGLIAGRQNGKDVVLEARELFGLFLHENDLLTIHSAHLYDTALRHFQRIEELIMACPDLDRFLVQHKGSVSRSHGKEGIEIIRDGERRELRFRTRTEGGGRGWTCDCLIFNEAMYLSGGTVGAILPTLSAVPDPQVIYAGSAGMKHSTALGRLRNRAMGKELPNGRREPKEPRLSFLEWSIEECSQFCAQDCQEHDQKPFRVTHNMPEEEVIRKTNRLIISYAKANPGWGIRIGGVRDPRQSFEHIQGEQRQMDTDEFLRERLGIGEWPQEGELWKIINEPSWMTCTDRTSSPKDPVAFCVELSPDRKFGVITVAGVNDDGLAHVEITGGDDLDYLPNDRWLLPRIKELIDRWNPCAVVIDKSSQAGSIIKPLRDHLQDRESGPGMSKERVDELVISPTLRDYAQACGWFASAVVPPSGGSSLIIHRDQIPLTTAVAGADKRDIADLWVWDVQNTAVDICPLKAATLAIWGHQQNANKVQSVAPWVVVR